MYFDIMDDPDYPEESVSFDIAPQRVCAKTAKNPSCVTYHSNVDAFKHLHEPFVRDLAAEPFYWKRPYAKGPAKEIYCNVEFIKYQDWQRSSLPSTSSELLGPILHTFWCDCQNLELYRTTLKDQLTAWTALLDSTQQEWLIILLVRPEIRKTPRTKPTPRLDVFEKIKSDFCGKPKDRERCLFIWDPKSGMGDAESWRICILRFRQFVFDSHEARLRTFEDQVRTARENRKKPEFKLSEYFSLREMLATAYQRLTFSDEALLHLDELDSLISQFVAEVAEEPENSIHQVECSRVPSDWLGIQLGKDSVNMSRSIAIGNGSLLEMRSCLFIRQCELLLELNRSHEIMARALPFIQNVNQDNKLFQVKIIPGALDCWTFLVCHEIRQSAVNSGDGYIFGLQNSATLQGIELEKLSTLGRICGLYPHENITEEQQLLLSVLAKAIEAPYPSTAILKLYDALHSHEKFMKSFLEMSEMTMGTFKHIGRARAARLIGVDLAEYYMKLDKFENAANFLLDAVKNFKNESWDFASADVAIQYCVCALALKQWDQVIKSSLLVASCQYVRSEERIRHQQILTRVILDDGLHISPVLGSGNAISVSQTRSSSHFPLVYIGQEYGIEITVESGLPDSILIEEIVLCIVPMESSRSHLQARRMTSQPSWDLDSITAANNPSTGSTFISCSSTSPSFESAETVRSFPSVKFSQPKRTRSGVKSPDHVDWKDIPGDALLITTKAARIAPGGNRFVFKTQIEHAGDYRFHQLRIRCTKTFSLAVPIEPKFDPHLRIYDEEPTCNVEAVSSTGVCWMHETHCFRLSLIGPVVSKLGDQLFSLTTNNMDLELIDLQGDALPVENLISCATTNTFQFLARCRSSRETFTGEIFAKFPWTKIAHSFTVSFYSPVMLKMSGYSCPPSSFFAIEIVNRFPGLLAISDVQLTPTDSTEYNSLTYLSQAFRSFKMKTQEKVRLIWKSDEKFNGSVPLIFQMCYTSESKEIGEHVVFWETFSPGTFGSMRVQITSVTSIQVDNDVQVGENLLITYNIISTDVPANMPPVYYQIKFDNSRWTSINPSCGVIELREDDPIALQFSVVASKTGEALLPVLRLFYLRNEDIILMESFHVYNGTLYTPIKIRSPHGRIHENDPVKFA